MVEWIFIFWPWILYYLLHQRMIVYDSQNLYRAVSQIHESLLASAHIRVFLNSENQVIRKYLEQDSTHHMLSSKQTLIHLAKLFIYEQRSKCRPCITWVSYRSSSLERTKPLRRTRCFGCAYFAL